MSYSSVRFKINVTLGGYDFVGSFSIELVLHYIGPQVFQQENSIQPSLPQPFRIYEFVILVLLRLQQFSLRERYFYFEFLLLSVLRRNSF